MNKIDTSEKLRKTYSYILYRLNPSTKMWEFFAMAEYQYIAQEFAYLSEKGCICIVLPKPFGDYLPMLLHTRDFAKICIRDDESDISPTPQCKNCGHVMPTEVDNCIYCSDEL
jgi:hypothetical protein